MAIRRAGKSRLFAVLLIICCFILLVRCQEAAQEDLATDNRKVDKAQDVISGVPFASAHDAEQKILVPEQLSTEPEGQSLVESALKTLETLEKPKARHSKVAKPVGLVAKLYHFVKEILVFLFMNKPDDNADPRARRSQTAPLKSAVEQLEMAASRDNPDALYLLAEMNFWGNYTHPRNYKTAFQHYKRLATITGNNTAQHMLGFMYATGIGGSVERDQSKAMLYHTFAAQGGNTKSEMTMAYRHHNGIGLPVSCEEAKFYYKRVADKAVDYIRSGPPGGINPIEYEHKLTNDVGGLYGEGASESSAGRNAKDSNPSSKEHASLDDYLEYLDAVSKKGDVQSTLRLAEIHYRGSRRLRRNLVQAKSYFKRIAIRVWVDGKVNTRATEKTQIYAARAAGYLGWMALRGEGMEQNFQQAKIWFDRGAGAIQSDSISQFGLGLMYLNGYGVPKNPRKAASYFKAGADQDHGPSQLYVGKLFLDHGDIDMARKFLNLAAQNNQVEAWHLLAEMYSKGVGTVKSCGLATTYFKLVSEQVEPIHSPFNVANEALEEGDVETALVIYMMTAEQGYESAQSNAAFLLDKQRSSLKLFSYLLPRSKVPKVLDDDVMALAYLTRSAKSSNIDSRVKMGDYYLAGLGAPKSLERAASCYQAASDTQKSAQAMWNIGWMHEHGIGLDQDYHLAKRFYDKSYETNTEAYLPVTISLLKLRIKSAWNTLTHGKINSIQEEPNIQKQWSMKEWINNFLAEEVAAYAEEAVGKEERKTEMLGANPVEDSMPGGDIFFDELDESLLEGLLIISLMAALAFLVYWRQRRQQNRGAPVNNGGAAAGNAPDNNDDRGVFPRPDEPEFAQWVAGGIGH